MTITNPLKLDTIVFTSPSCTFQACQEVNLQEQIETETQNPAGHPSPLFATVKRAKPMVSFKTPEIDVLASNMPAWGIAPGATVYKKLSSGVAPLSRTATSHNKTVLTACIAYWSNITIPARDIATADITVCPIYDGTNEPFIVTASVALAGTLTQPNYYCAGPAWVTDDAGTPVTTSIPSIDSIEIASGCQFRSDGDCSSVYDTYGEVTIDNCEITIKSKTAFNITTWPQQGTNLTAFRVFARKFKPGGAFVSNATTSHIKFSGTSALLIPMNSQASGQELYADTFKLVCMSPDGVTAPITMTVGVAIA